jgi:hypothetical protein
MEKPRDESGAKNGRLHYLRADSEQQVENVVWKASM